MAGHEFIGRFFGILAAGAVVAGGLWLYPEWGTADPLKRVRQARGDSTFDNHSLQPQSSYPPRWLPCDPSAPYQNAPASTYQEYEIVEPCEDFGFGMFPD